MVRHQTLTLACVGSSPATPDVCPPYVGAYIRPPYVGTHSALPTSVRTAPSRNMNDLYLEALRGVIAAWQQGDALRAAAYFAPEASYAEAGQVALVGRDALVAHFTRFFRDGPRWRFDVDDVILEGVRACVVYRFAITGVRGTWNEREGCAIVRFAQNGAILTWREYGGETSGSSR